MNKINFKWLFVSLLLLTGGVIFITPQPIFLDNPYITIHGTNNETQIPVELAKTEEEIQKGLSNRASLEPDQGMLFVFNEPKIYKFWMRDMQFPLDMIWINNDKIVGIEKNIPANFNHENPIFYSPPEPAQYMLEVNAGFAEANNINIGNTVFFDIIKH